MTSAVAASSALKSSFASTASAAAARDVGRGVDARHADDVAVGRLRVTGLWCTSCAHALEKAFRRVDGVVDAHVSFAAGEAAVRYAPSRVTLAAIAAAGVKIGYGAAVADDDHDATDDAVGDAVNDLAVRLAASLVFGMWSMGASWALLVVDDIAPATAVAVARLAVAAAVPVVFFAGAPFLRAGYRTTRVGAPGMDALVSVGALLSLSLSIWHVARGEATVYVDTATMLITLLLTGRLIEHAARRRGAMAMRSLLFGLPPSARRVVDDGSSNDVVDVLAKDVVVGDVVVVEAGRAGGDVVPIDGVVVDGAGEVSTAVVSGEATPQAVAVGSLVLAGSRVVSGVLRLRVVAGVGARRVDVLAARARALLVARDGLASLAERAARALVPVVFVVAVAAGAVVFVGGGDVEAALLRAVAVIVVTCPCALGLATPAALLSASASARRRGIVFRDVHAVEAAARLDTVAFDKTGTLTTGHLRLVAVHDASGHIVNDDDVRARHVALAAAIEGEVAHPVAEALRVAAGSSVRPRVGQRQVRLGHGVQVVLDDGASASLRRRAAADLTTGSTKAVIDDVFDNTTDLVVELVVDDAVVAAFSFDDALRPDAAGAVKALQARGVRVCVLSGDTPARANRLGRALGLAEGDVRGGLSPEDKVSAVLALRGSGAVAFVGDGDNDAAALAAADLGIAVQGGTTAALESAPIVLQQPGVAVVADALRLAAQAARVMRQNLIFAVAFNAVMVPAAVLGHVSPLWAAIAMGSSSLVVTLNALRAR